MRWLLVSVSSLVLSGCLSFIKDASRHGQRYSNTADEQGDARVGQFISSEWSFNTSSYWIEGPDGLLLIDAQFLPTALEKQNHYARLKTGKKPLLAVVLHPNPDRFNGTGFLAGQGVPVVTSDEVLERIPAVHRRWVSTFMKTHWQSGYPQTLVLPGSLGSGNELGAGGLSAKVHRLGPGASPVHLVVEWEGHLFVGDLVSNGSHGWFEDGRIDEWLKRLDELRALNPKFIHPGHGMTGGPELLDQQRAYLEAVIAAVASESPRGSATPEALTRINEAIVARYPKYAQRHFLTPLVQREWARQAAVRIRNEAVAGSR
jgi:glyoxylase-like metal-dependent hydrolase (beta-lactamase superfamily II)